MDDDRRSMLIFLFFLLFIPIDSIRSSRNLNELLHQQYENRQNYSEKQTNFSRPWPKSNSIVMLKQYIANRQRLANTTRSTSPTTITTTTSSSTRVSPRLLLRSDQNVQTTNQVVVLPRIQNTTFIVTTMLTTSETSTTNTTTTTSTTHSTMSDTTRTITTMTTSTSHIIAAQNSNSTVLIIILVCTFSGVLLLGLIVLFLLRRRISIAYLKLPCIHSSSGTKHSRDNTPLSSSPIHAKFKIPDEFPVEQLYDIYLQKHAMDDLAFAVEFKSIPNFDDLPCAAATRSIVASKNRFLNILPIDTTRVILNLLNDDPSSDYINGNYISGYKCPKKFIATQGPKPDTCEDFWRMMWELKLKSIVMLTNVIEGASRMTKCHQYWPDLGQPMSYGSYRVMCIDVVSAGDYDKRYFQLSKITNVSILPSSSSITAIDDALSTSTVNSSNDDDQSRLIIQYHYTQWKDMDVPSDSHSLLHLIREVNEQTNVEQYPIVVHCTAGVGRTGTYIAVDAMIDKIEQEKKVDIYNFVLEMRRERNLMVQTVKQYVFIYRSLLEYYLYGNTRIEANLFRSTYSNLKKNKQNLLRAEFNKLSLLPVENISKRDAHLPDNIDRNRHPQIVPYDRNRVCLSRILGHPYINASFVEGYSRQCSFIVTQDPLLETIHEFWRMFIEHDTDCIVQIHTITDSSPKCPIYYPNDYESTMKIGSTTLLKLVEKEFIQDTMIIRQFCLTDTREALSKTIFHFEYLPPIASNDEHENEHCLPTMLTNSLIDFIGHINKRRLSNHHDRFITVHCGNGGPSCSIFCMCVMLLDQLKNEHAVDIFQRVRVLQRQRFAMIINLAQYEFLYEMISKFLEESFDLAAAKSSPSLNNSVYDNHLLDSDDLRDRL